MTLVRGLELTELLATERATVGLARPVRARAIRERLGCSEANYVAALAAAAELPEALEHDPMTVRRLQRLRDHRRAARSALVAVTPRPGADPGGRSARDPRQRALPLGGAG